MSRYPYFVISVLIIQRIHLNLEHCFIDFSSDSPVVFNAEGQTFIVQQNGHTIKIVPQTSPTAADRQNDDEVCPICGDKISGMSQVYM